MLFILQYIDNTYNVSKNIMMPIEKGDTQYNDEENQKENIKIISTQLVCDNKNIDINEDFLDEEKEEFNSSLQLDFSEQKFSGVNVENSSEVVVGPVTNFNGQVIIYQNPLNTPCPTNNTLFLQSGYLFSPNSNENSAIRFEQPPRLLSNENHMVPTSKLSDHTAFAPKIKKYWYKFALFLALLLAIIIIVLVYFFVNVIKVNEKELYSFPFTENERTTLKNDGFLLKKERDEKSLSNLTSLNHPIKIVIICHTAGQNCSTSESCSSLVWNIQQYHIVSLKFPDIGYNFLVGHDNNVYIGRGWDFENAQKNDTISISFIGNYNNDKINKGQVQAVQDLLNEGVKLGKLSSDYKLIAHSQIARTQSPGENLYKEIKTWAHWTPEEFKT